MKLGHVILIVDDEEPLRRSLSIILQRENYRVVTAASAEEALVYLQQQKFDLMFLDLSMPGMSGIDLLLQVRKQFPHMTVLILTAHAALESAIQALRLEARDYLIKPIEPALIVSRVRELLTESEQPARKRVIVDEIHSLLAELQKIDGEDVSPGGDAGAPAGGAGWLKKGPFELDLDAQHALLNGRYLPVSGVYFHYLRTLLRHAPKAVSYRVLVREAQGYDADFPEARDLARWRIHELRKVIEADARHPQFIRTVRGTGYRLVI